MTVVWFGNIVSWTDAHAKIQKEHELNNDQIYARVLRLDKRKEKSVPKWFRISSYLFLILQIVITIIKLITQVHNALTGDLTLTFRRIHMEWLF